MYAPVRADKYETLRMLLPLVPVHPRFRPEDLNQLLRRSRRRLHDILGIGTFAAVKDVDNQAVGVVLNVRRRLVGLGGALIGMGGLLLSFLKTGQPLLSRERILAIFPALLLATTLAFVAGFASI